MVSPPPPANDDGSPSAPLLPTTGVESSSVFDLPYAVDDSLPPPPQAAPVATLPPPPAPRPAGSPVLPPTFSTPAPPVDFASPVMRSSDRRPPPAMPAPLAAGPLSGPLLDEDYGEAPLPPMVAKGDWVAGDPADDVPQGGRSTPDGSSPAAPTGRPDPGPAPARGPLGAAPPDAAPAVAPALPFSPEVAWPSTSGSTPAVPPLAAAFEPLPTTPTPRAVRTDGPLLSTTRLVDGLLVAAAGAAVAGVVWWAVVALTERQWVYLAILLGGLVGQAALVGGRRGSVALGVLAASLTLVSLTITQYFITRSLAISELGADVPLWDGTSAAAEIIRETFREEPSTGIFVVIAAVVAGVQAGSPGRRAMGSWGEPRPSRPVSKIL